MRTCCTAAFGLLAGLGLAVSASAAEPGVRLITLDPGHFHAGLIQKEMYPGVDPTVHVYAPLGPDLLAHLGRVSAFNRRAESPTSWRLEVHTGEDSLERMLREKPGNVVVLSGRNRGKIDRILASVEAGLNVLADKPWLIAAADFPKLEKALSLAETKGLVAYDVMTERSEITTILQKELALDPAVTGRVGPGTPAEPAFEMESVHHLMKMVAGSVNLRPAWFFDTAEQGEALGDVATHLVDLVPWTLFPGQAIDYRTEVGVLSAKKWPTVLDEGAAPEADRGEDASEGARLAPAGRQARLLRERRGVLHRPRRPRARQGALELRGPGGSRRHPRRLRARQPGPPRDPAGRGAEVAARALRGAQPSRRRAGGEGGARAPGGRAREGPPRPHRRGRGRAASASASPTRYRVGHEPHFAEVTARFLGYLKDPASLPKWEKANMLAKYWVTTQAVELSR